MTMDHKVQGYKSLPGPLSDCHVYLKHENLFITFVIFRLSHSVVVLYYSCPHVTILLNDHVNVHVNILLAKF